MEIKSSNYSSIQNSRSWMHLLPLSHSLYFLSLYIHIYVCIPPLTFFLLTTTLFLSLKPMSEKDGLFFVLSDNIIFYQVRFGFEPVGLFPSLRFGSQFVKTEAEVDAWEMCRCVWRFNPVRSSWHLIRWIIKLVTSNGCHWISCGPEL